MTNLLRFLSPLFNRVSSLLASFQNFLILQNHQAIHSKLLIVTAFDSSHYFSALNLLRSIYSHEPSANIMVFNLGISKREEEHLMELFPRIIFRPFSYSEYPSYYWVKLDAGFYAWKSACISEAAISPWEHILWMDAGNILNGRLTVIQKMIEKYKIFAIPTSNSIQELTHPKTVQHFKIDFLSLKTPQLSAAFIGFCLKDSNAKRVLDLWSFLSQKKEVIAPDGATSLNHRFDQSLLNLILMEDSFFSKTVLEICQRKYSQKLSRIACHQDIDEKV
jgi:hypothetical protein